MLSDCRRDAWVVVREVGTEVQRYMGVGASEWQSRTGCVTPSGANGPCGWREEDAAQVTFLRTTVAQKDGKKSESISR